MPNPKRRRTIEEEIKDTEALKDVTGSVSVNISMPRGLYLHALYTLREGEFSSLSAFISALLRWHKHYSEIIANPPPKPPGAR